jgi:CRISPR-associated endonuclease/helicase Cas3
MPSFGEFFKRATGNDPFPFQRRFAEEGEVPQLVDVPTGLGKTAMATLGWLWRRRLADKEVRNATPRRLIYCLPMRVLVEQTRDNALLWLRNLELLANPTDFCPDKVPVHVLMGGEDEEDWDIYPEREQIIIGTQDMLLSRVLNRGYAATRSRWPIQFGLLNTDCLWVFDEIQLMGAGLATTTQLEAFRWFLPNNDAEGTKNAHSCWSVWMSATMGPEWLKTVDFAPFLDAAPKLPFEFESEIQTPGLDATARKTLEDRWGAKKPLEKAKATIGDAEELAKEVLQAHKLGTRTIVIVNTVKRACAFFDELDRIADRESNSSKPKLVLLHSRFRPRDRQKQIDEGLADIKPGETGTIVVSTQVIEAGVDVSATTLFTEVAPWASLVKRFGRCNRRGESNDAAAVHWIGLPAKHADAEKLAAPYELRDINDAAKELAKLTDVGLSSLPEICLGFEHVHVIRRKDLIDLFDTTPDLAGNDIDIDGFVRDVEDSDVRVFWRDWDQPKGYEPPPEEAPAPQREEVCPVPIGSDKSPGFREFVKKHPGKVWRWSFLDRKWERLDDGKIIPGQVFLLHCNAGGYLEDRGWDSSSKKHVDQLLPQAATKRDAPDATGDEPLSRIGVWQTIAEHSNDLVRAVNRILDALPVTPNEVEVLRHAARWHDRGKAHLVFQNAVDDGQRVERKAHTVRRERPEQWRGCRFIAKAPDKQKDTTGQIIDPGFWRRYDWVPKEGRRHFRHELASALSVLDPRNDKIPDELRELVAYLVAAHHGKVRLSIRSLPNELHPNGNRRFARGVWDDDELPETDLGGNVTAPAIRLSLEPMELGLCEQEPFKDFHHGPNA